MDALQLGDDGPECQLPSCAVLVTSQVELLGGQCDRSLRKDRKAQQWLEWVTKEDYPTYDMTACNCIT